MNSEGSDQQRSCSSRLSCWSRAGVALISIFFGYFCRQIHCLENPSGKTIFGVIMTILIPESVFLKWNVFDARVITAGTRLSCAGSIQAS